MSNMNLPNKLTLMRLCLVPVNVAVLLLPVTGACGFESLDDVP